jgi:hypothetical protein
VVLAALRNSGAGRPGGPRAGRPGRPDVRQPPGSGRPGTPASVSLAARLAKQPARHPHRAGPRRLRPCGTRKLPGPGSPRARRRRRRPGLADSRSVRGPGLHRSGTRRSPGRAGLADTRSARRPGLERVRKQPTDHRRPRTTLRRSQPIKHNHPIVREPKVKRNCSHMYLLVSGCSQSSHTHRPDTPVRRTAARSALLRRNLVWVFVSVRGSGLA